MALPRKLKNMLLFNDGVSYAGEAASVTLPNLTRVFEEWRGAGMDTPVKIDMGGGALEMEWGCGGYMKQVVRQFGIIAVDGVMLRFAGAYQSDSTGGVDAVEIIVRGRHEEIDRGEAKPGEDTEFGVKTALVYYKEIVNGTVEAEIDALNMIFITGGVDRLAEQRRALGMDSSSLGGIIAPPRITLPRGFGGLGGLGF